MNRMKPILFSTPMVIAILDGRKTQTRRVIKDKDITNWFDIDVDGKPIAYIDQETGDSYPPTHRAKYQPGDILWVQETWKVIRLLENMQMQFEYRADGLISKTIDFLLDRFTKFKKFADKHGWQSPYFMPREAARIFLKVTNVRVERLQEITVDDCRLEGCCSSDCLQTGPHSPDCKCDTLFYNVWNDISAKRGYGWDTNPWVWVVKFERISKDEAYKKEGLKC
jgi:hypothetical protein